MSNLDKLKILPDCQDVGKVPITGGRYIVVSTASRLEDGSGCGVYLDLEDKNGNVTSLAAMIDHLTEEGDPAIHLFASYCVDSDELEEAHNRWSKEEIENVENPPEPAKKAYSITFSTTVGVEAKNREEAVKLAEENLDKLGQLEVVQVDEEA